MSRGANDHCLLVLRAKFHQAGRRSVRTEINHYVSTLDHGAEIVALINLADEFQVLVRSGDYAVWVAANGKDPGRSGAHGAVQARLPTDPHQLKLSPLRQEPSEPIPSGHDNDREGELWP